MTNRNTDPRQRLPDDKRLKNFLRDLKETGGSFLVTGKVSDRVANHQMQIAFGLDDRKRVLGTKRAPNDCLPDAVSPTDTGVRIVNRRAALRSAAAPIPDETPTQTGHYLELMHFRQAIEAEIDSLDDAFDLAPGGLRVVVTDLDGLLADTDRATVRGFVRGLSRFVRDVNGIIYVHLRYPDTADITRYFAEVVDARIELRYGTHEEFRPEERWHVPKLDLTSEWNCLHR